MVQSMELCGVEPTTKVISWEQIGCRLVCAYFPLSGEFCQKSSKCVYHAVTL
jgi:hypothetical protein